MRREAEELQILLKFEKDRHPVGVRFLFSEQEYKETDAPEATHQMFFCMMVKAAAVGHSMKAKPEHIYCSAAAGALGFMEPDSDTRRGITAWKRGLYGSHKAAEDISAHTPYLDHKPYGMCIQPLEKWEQEPDVVMMFCLPYTVMRIVQAYSYRYGVAKQITLTGMSGICTELMAGAYKRQDMNVSLLCSGTRFAGCWRDDEMGVALPYAMFREILESVRATANLYEPDDKKEEILERAEERGIAEDITMGTNYHGSSIGVARMGVKGYRPRRRRDG